MSAQEALKRRSLKYLKTSGDVFHGKDGTYEVWGRCGRCNYCLDNFELIILVMNDYSYTSMKALELLTDLFILYGTMQSDRFLRIMPPFLSNTRIELQ